MKKKNMIILVFRVISIIIVLFCISIIIEWHFENKNTEKIMEEIINKTEITEDKVKIDDNEITINIPKLSSNDVAWLTVNNTNINYPVVQYSNNEYYLNHSYSGKYNTAGWIFADYRNNFSNLDRNTVIYGHNRKDGSMFNSLKNVLTNEWYKNEKNHYINLTLHDKNTIWQVFSVYKIKSTVKNINAVDFDSNDDYFEYIDIVSSRSIYDFNVEISTNDNILTLYTCGSDNTRIILHAKLVLF